MFLSRVVIFIVCLYLSACQTVDKYKIQSHDIDGIELQVVRVSSERIRQKCLFLNAEEGNEWRHQYLIFILGDKNDVLEIAAPHNTDQKSCLEQILQIEKILRFESEVKMCVRGGLKNKTAREGSWEETVDFGPRGIHKINHESLTLDTICNSKNCYGDNSAYTYTCPGFIKQ